MSAQPGQREKADRLLALHAGPRILVLPNAWDVASARIFAAHAACRALATTSAGVASVLGYPDGEVVPPAEMLELVARIARSVELPVTADLEAGYGDSPEAAAETARAAVAAGAVGLNLEDGLADGTLADPASHAEKVQAAREAAAAAGVPLVVNARTDVYLNAVGEPAGRFDETVRRLRAYRAAGADCLFAPGVADAETIGRLAAALDGPLNVLAGPTTPPVAELERLGVRRVSVGSGPSRATLALTARIAAELLEEGRFDFAADAMPYDEVQRLLSADAGRPG